MKRDTVLLLLALCTPFLLCGSLAGQKLRCLCTRLLIWTSDRQSICFSLAANNANWLGACLPVYLPASYSGWVCSLFDAA